jgi:hypothetical protein
MDEGMEADGCHRGRTRAQVGWLEAQALPLSTTTEPQTIFFFGGAEAGKGTV